MSENYVVVALADGIFPMAWTDPMTEELANEKAKEYNLRQGRGYTIYNVWTIEKLKDRVGDQFKDE